MKLEEQKIAIAEACGWEVVWDGDYGGCHPKLHEPDEDAVALPDYLNSLDAMHEAEKVLSEEQWLDYTDYLCINGTCPGWCGFNLAHATAAQRAEALLKTLNLWKETE